MYSIESYGPKFVENIVQTTARDILCYAMKTLRNCSIVMHIHDEAASGQIPTRVKMLRVNRWEELRHGLKD